MYHFNLEPLLRHRKFTEESKQKELSLVQRELNHELKILSDLKERQIQLVKEFKDKQTIGMQPYEFCMYRTYTSRLQKEIENQQKSVENIEVKVNMARAELLTAVKDRKTLEKLKEKKKKEFTQKIYKKEQLLTNESAVIRFNRKSQ